MSGRLPYSALIVALALLTLAAFAASLSIGPSGLGVSAMLDGLFSGRTDTVGLIAREVRLPRALLALAVGATLGLAGAALQGYLRNPLAEPGVIGISGAGALGAVIAIYTGASQSLPLALPGMAIAFSLGAVALLHTLSGKGGILTLVLAGVGISSLAGALTSLALNLSPNPYASHEIVFWMLGSVSDRSMQHVYLAAPFMATGWALLLASSRGLDALTLGEESAHSLGINLQSVRWLVILGAALSVGAATAVSGVIGFVGLIVPHLLRPWVGHHPGRLLPASALGGALLLLCADVGVRLITPGTELKLGVLTALIGAPFFLWLILHTRRARVL